MFFFPIMGAGDLPEVPVVSCSAWPSQVHVRAEPWKGALFGSQIFAVQLVMIRLYEDPDEDAR